MMMCPQDFSNQLHLDVRGQNAIVALGVYLLESGLQVGKEKKHNIDKEGDFFDIIQFYYSTMSLHV